MTRAAGRQTRAVPARPRPWTGYAAAAWAWLFAAPHFYWGVGGATGLDTALTRTFVKERRGWFLALKWAIGAFCVPGGLVALAAVRPWGHGCPAGSRGSWPGSAASCSPCGSWTSTSSSGSL
jgi:hypothetical protein